MSEFVWKDSFNIGVEEIDQQHQSLLKLLNKCVEQADEVKKKKVLDEDDYRDAQNLMDELVAYTDTHFKTEERLMSSTNYPDLEHHQNQHYLLTEQVMQLKESVVKKEKSSINSISVLLRDWYIQHIMDEDKRIGAYVQSDKK